MIKLFGRGVKIALAFLAVVIIAAVILNWDSTTEITGGTTLNIPTLASCLNEKAVKFYGSMDSESTKEQKALFTESEIQDLYVECGHFNGFTTKCQDMGIEITPTWIINDQVYTGFKTREELKTLANC